MNIFLPLRGIQLTLGLYILIIRWYGGVQAELVGISQGRHEQEGAMSAGRGYM